MRVFHVELSRNVLDEGLHSPGTAPDAHKLGKRKKKVFFLINILIVLFWFFSRKTRKSITLTSPNMAGRSWVEVPKLKW